MLFMHANQEPTGPCGASHFQRAEDRRIRGEWRKDRIHLTTAIRTETVLRNFEIGTVEGDIASQQDREGVSP